MEPLTICPVKTRIFDVNENIEDFIVESVPQKLVKEKMVLAITSKIVSLAEGRLVKSETVTDKKALIRQEADHFLGELNYGSLLTIKHGLLVPSAGIDESNSENGDYILYPVEPYVSAEKIWKNLKKAWGVKELAVILTDSRTGPLRRGVTGVCLSYFGFRGIRNMVGQEDLFGRPLRMTQVNLADSLATSAVMMMGEGNEATPLALIYGAPIEFSDISRPEELQMSLEDDMYRPLLEAMRKQTNT